MRQWTNDQLCLRACKLYRERGQSRTVEGNMGETSLLDLRVQSVCTFGTIEEPGLARLLRRHGSSEVCDGASGLTVVGLRVGRRGRSRACERLRLRVERGQGRRRDGSLLLWIQLGRSDRERVQYGGRRHRDGVRLFEPREVVDVGTWSSCRAQAEIAEEHCGESRIGRR